MSRAFVKEGSDAPPPPPPERPVSAAPNLVTPRGARLIAQEVAALQGLLAAPAAPDVTAIRRRDLRYWQSRLASMHVVTPDATPQAVSFGVRVTIRRGNTEQAFTIVGEDEADPSAGLLAWTAPLARSLADAAANEVVEFEAGGRTEPITVIGLATGDVA